MSSGPPQQPPPCAVALPTEVLQEAADFDTHLVPDQRVVERRMPPLQPQFFGKVPLGRHLGQGDTDIRIRGRDTSIATQHHAVTPGGTEEAVPDAPVVVQLDDAVAPLPSLLMTEVQTLGVKGATQHRQPGSTPRSGQGQDRTEDDTVFLNEVFRQRGEVASTLTEAESDDRNVALVVVPDLLGDFRGVPVSNMLFRANVTIGRHPENQHPTVEPDGQRLGDPVRLFGLLLKTDGDDHRCQVLAARSELRGHLRVALLHPANRQPGQGQNGQVRDSQDENLPAGEDTAHPQPQEADLPPPVMHVPAPGTFRSVLDPTRHDTPQVMLCSRRSCLQPTQFLAFVKQKIAQKKSVTIY